MEKILFVKKIIALYENNCRIEPQTHPLVIRGRGRTISSETEDLFGIYVSELLGDKYKMYIDTRISVGGKDFFPDITICRGEKILQMWDLKMDLGWMRGKLWDMIDKNEELIGNIKSQKVKTGAGKHLNGFAFAEDITYNFAIITLCNGGKDDENIYNYATGKSVEIGDKSLFMEDKQSKVFFIFKYKNLEKGKLFYDHDGYHPNWGFTFKDEKEEKREYDLERKLRAGTFEELKQFISALKSNHIDSNK